MSQAVYFIQDPEFSEFVYNAMATCPLHYKQQLSNSELRYFQDEQSMSRFANKETMEKRLLLLARIGIPYCIIVAPRKPEVETVMNEVVTQWKIVEKRKAIMEAMNNNKVFVISNNDVLISAHMAAQNSHGQPYVLNRRYVEMQHRLTDKNRENDQQQFKSARKGFDLLSSIILNTQATYENCRALCGVEQQELAILLALYPERNNYISVDELVRQLHGTKRSSGIAKSATKLENKGYIQRLPGYDGKTKEKKYTIANNGIDAVMAYLKYIENLSFQ